MKDANFLASNYAASHNPRPSERSAGENDDIMYALPMSDSISEAAAGRRLVVTRSKRIAYVPMPAREGDQICILRGGRVPYVIRPVSTQEPRTWRFVGECWVDGLMYHQEDELKLDDEIRLL